MKIEEIAEQAYETWDLHGGRALGFWGAPYTKEAWVEVVGKILELLSDLEPEELNDATT